MAILAVTGCQTPLSIAATQTPPQSAVETAAPARATTQQLILKFKPDTFACNAEGIAQFASEVDVLLEFVRAMSGDACVIKQLTFNSAELVRDQERLRHHPAVLLLEQDTKKKAL